MSGAKCVGAVPRCARHVVKFCAEEAGRFALHAVRIEFAAGCTRLLATNGRKLIVATYRDERCVGDGVALVDGRQLASMLKHHGPDASARQPNVLLKLNEKGVVEIDFAVVRASLHAVDGKFPEYAEVIPTPEKCEGQKPGECVALGVNVVAPAMRAAWRAVGSDYDRQGLRIYLGGPKGAVRIEVRNCEASAEAVVVVMPIAVE